MDDRVKPEPLTDAALARVLAEALDVRPSPEFLARVRMRVAEEPVPAFRLKPEATTWLVRRFRSSFRLQPEVLLAAVAALLLMAAVLWRPAPESPALSARLVLPFSVDAPRVASDAVSASIAPSVTVSPRARRVPAPQVIVARDEVEAIMTLVRHVQEGRIVMLAPGSVGPVEYAAPLDVTLAPITIEPLPRLAPLQEVRQ